MKNIEMMKQYIRENNLTGQVRELVNGADMDSEDAIEYVYDAHVMLWLMLLFAILSSRPLVSCLAAAS